MTDLINKAAALEELSKLSRNAKLFLQDRLGNELHAIRFSFQVGRYDLAKEAIDNMQKDLDSMKLFDTTEGR